MSDGMGLLRTDVEIEAPASGERRRLPQVIVDTSGLLSWAPAAVLESLGIARAKQLEFQPPDGTVMTRWVGFAVLHVAEGSTVDEVVFGEPDDLPRLGSRTLSGMNLKVDPVGKRLVPAGPVLAAAVSGIGAAAATGERLRGPSRAGPRSLAAPRAARVSRNASRGRPTRRSSAPSLRSG